MKQLAELVVSGLFTFISAFLVSLILTPFLIRRLKVRGLVGIDMNKYDKPEVSEIGGIGVLFGFSFGIMIAIFGYSYLGLLNLDLTVLLAAFSTIILIGLLGILDDLIGWKHGIRKWQHALVPLFAALPLMAIQVGTTEMNIPFIGVVSFGILYSLILIPIGVTGASNAFNMLAGFNGLEAGQGIIMLTTLSAIAFFTGRVEALVLGIALIGALIAFLKYNWYPAKAFGGDSLTLMIGASIASISIIGDMERIGITLMALYFIELFLKAKHMFRSECFGIPREDGTLKPNPKGGSITQLVMRLGRFGEKQVVYIIFAMQSVIAVIVFLLFWFKLYV